MNSNGHNNDKKETTEPCDENMHLIVYGNLKIKDVKTGEVLVNKPW
jgi:hypothetical protein